MAIDLASHMQTVAAALCGEVNARLSTKTEMRFGRNGSLSVDLEKGTWYDHQESAGGGVLDLIKARKGLEGAEAFAFMRELGCDVGDDREPARNGHDHAAGKRDEGKRVVEATYDYRDEKGRIVFQVVRCAFQKPDGSFIKTADGKKKKKAIFQRRPDGTGGWVNNLQGVNVIPYRLSELKEAIADDRTVYVVEGEKKVDALWSIGAPATCNPMGAGKWPEHFRDYFAGARVVVLPDNDEPGFKHAAQVGENIDTVTASNMVLDLPDLPSKGDVIDWLQEGGTADELAELGAKARPFGEAKAPEHRESRFGAVRWHEQDAVHQPYEWAVKGLIPRRCPVMIVGEMQSGKSFWTYGAAMAVARGIEFFGNRVPAAGAVIYGAMEAGQGFRNRMRAYRQHHGLTLDAAMPFAVLTREANLFNAEIDLDMLIEECLWLAGQMTAPLEAVVIDTYNAATPGLDENNSGEVSKVVAKMKTIMRRTNAGLWLVHHKNKQGGVRGSTALAAAFETVIEISRVIDGTHGAVRDADRREIRNAKVVKQREGVDGEGFNFVLPAVEIGRDGDGDPITSCVVEAPAAAASDGHGPKAFKLNDGEEKLFRSILEAIMEGGIAPPPALSLPASIGKVVDYKLVRTIFQSKMLAVDDDPRAHADRIKKQLQRAGTALRKFGVIGSHNQTVWLTGKAVRGTTGHVIRVSGGHVDPSEGTETGTGSESENG
jgi:hypothetical protein